MIKLTSNSKQIILDIICYLYALLFVYASGSKLLDFENFKVQLGQSPLLSSFAEWISVVIPVSELVITFLLLTSKFRLSGLYSALILMTMFSVYIFIVLHYSSFVPCSCGGVLEKMSWNTHLLFNLVFVLLAITGILIYDALKNKIRENKIYKSAYKNIVISITASIASIVILYASSEQIMHYNNPFLRRYPTHPALFKDNIDLKFNSYYFAGYHGDKIYLGNYTNPLHLLEVDSSLKKRNDVKIIFDPKKIPFQMVKIKILDSFFYLMDGNVPKVFRGRTTDWKINKELKGIPYFTLAEPIDSVTIAFRSNNGKNFANVLGTFTSDTIPKIKYNGDLLQRQIDGVFDTDGMLLYSQKIDKILYLYCYRNEFIVADKTGKLSYRGHTLDTITKAKIKVAYLKNKTERKMKAPPLVVNANSVFFKNLLFVHSKIKGRYEDDKLWEQASIIDVYDIKKNAYLLSFPIYNIGDSKLNSFFITKTHLYAIIGNKLAVYELRSILKKEIDMLK